MLAYSYSYLHTNSTCILACLHTHTRIFILILAYSSTAKYTGLLFASSIHIHFDRDSKPAGLESVLRMSPNMMKMAKDSSMIKGGEDVKMWMTVNFSPGGRSGMYEQRSSVHLLHAVPSHCILIWLCSAYYYGSASWMMRLQQQQQRRAVSDTMASLSLPLQGFLLLLLPLLLLSRTKSYSYSYSSCSCSCSCSFWPLLLWP